MFVLGFLGPCDYSGALIYWCCEWEVTMYDAGEYGCSFCHTSKYSQGRGILLHQDQCSSDRRDIYTHIHRLMHTHMHVFSCFDFLATPPPPMTGHKTPTYLPPPPKKKKQHTHTQKKPQPKLTSFCKADGKSGRNSRWVVTFTRVMKSRHTRS